MAETFSNHKLTAILYADVEGYSRLSSQDEMGTHKRVMAVLDFASEAIKQGDGTVLRYAGDAILAEFSSVLKLVQTAVDIQQELDNRNKEISTADKIQIRIGLNLGEVLQDRGEIFGDGVNLTARLEAAAVPGGICISASVHEQVKGKLQVQFVEGEKKVFKNIANPVQVYHWHPRGVIPGKQFTPSGELKVKPSIAVLPFANLSGDPEQEYFADGMVEEITTGLARIRWLTVIARNSSFAYKGTSPDVRDVGRELAVRYVVEGSVRKAGKNVRIGAQLVEAETGGHLWADKFTGSIDDVFDLQDQITAGVVAAIEPSVRQAEIERAKRKRPENLDAYDLYLRALEQSYIFTPAARSAGLSLLDAAIALEPDYVEAHGVAAFCLQQRYLWGGRAPADREAALRHAEAIAAARTDDTTALAFAALALSALDGRHDVALVMVDRALERNPSSAVAHNVSALINMMLGRPEQSVFHAERSLRLSPFDPLRHIPECALAVAKLAAGEHEAALACARKGVEANPAFTPGLTTLALCLVRLGRLDEARATVQRLAEIAPDTRITTLEERYLYAKGLGFDSIAEDLRAAGLPE